MVSASQKIAWIRAAAAKAAVDDYYIPTSDEHLNEYLPPSRKRREWASGFTGSAGDLVVGRSDAWLYADGRYHLQAERELEGTGISVMKVGQATARNVLLDLEERAKAHPGHTVGFDPMVVPLSVAEILEERLTPHGGRLVELGSNLVDAVWRDRPAPADDVLLELPAAWTGATPAEKLALVREDLKKAGAEAMAIVKLDQIAWLFNLRGRNDVPYNPVFEAFAYCDQREVHLFLRGGARRLPEGFAPTVPGLVVREYAEFVPFLGTRSARVAIDASAVTRGVASALEAGGAHLLRVPSPVEERKAVKNAAEQEAMRRANLHASVAKTRALLWLRREIGAGHVVTEDGFRQKIEALYAEQPDFAGLSFNTISATGPNGAIIHYGACDGTPLEKGHLFLIDSGAHLAGGTTDDTRTVAVGRGDAEARRLYTLVLKGHIAAARQQVPDGAPGTSLDALARAALWNEGLNYDHGTGHGVGCFLNVHEGPFAISERERKSYATNPLKEGIVSSIEPGYYREGFGGIRLENLYLYVRSGEPRNGRTWLKLEPLTWIPFDPVLIDDTRLDPAERSWLEAYQKGCVEKLSPLLPEKERYELRAMVG